MSIFTPERLLYRGQPNYFEGWYFRHTGAHPFSVIVGLSSAAANPHSFVQYIDKNCSHIFTYPLSALSFDDSTITLAENTFSLKGISARLYDGTTCIEIDTTYTCHSLYKKSLLAPSIMGVFSYLPMPCNHAVISLVHSFSGRLSIGDRQASIGGEGYIEKDYGKRFPKSYVWLHAVSSDISVMAAVAWPLPLVGRGFLCAVSHNGEQFNLSLGTGARLSGFSATRDSAEIVIRRGSTVVELKPKDAQDGSPLIAPSCGALMSDTIVENVAAPLSARILLKGKQVDAPTTCALEIVI